MHGQEQILLPADTVPVQLPLTTIRTRGDPMMHWSDNNRIACKGWPTVEGGWPATKDTTQVTCRACREKMPIRKPYSRPRVVESRTVTYEQIKAEFEKAIREAEGYEDASENP